MFTYCAIDGFHPVSENSENKLIVCKTPMVGCWLLWGKQTSKRALMFLIRVCKNELLCGLGWWMLGETHNE